MDNKPMNKAPESKYKDSSAIRVAALILAVFFLAFGWFTIWQGGVSLHGKSGASTFVDGRMGLAVAGFAVLLASVGVALLLGSFGARRKVRWICSGLVLALPVVFQLLRQ